jgi:hypothetical protein
MKKKQKKIASYHRLSPEFTAVIGNALNKKDK